MFNKTNFVSFFCSFLVLEVFYLLEVFLIIVSVILSVYNGEKFLQESISSILNQTYRNFEVIIIDDCSTDNTKKILERISDPRVKLIKNVENQGLTKNLNKGISIANGKYIARIDADDICFAHRFEKQVKFLETHTDIDMVGSNAIQIDHNGNFIRVTSLPITFESICGVLIFANPFIHPSVMIKKDVFKKISYDENYKSCQDYKLWVDMKKNGFKFWNIEDSLIAYRINYDGITRKESLFPSRRLSITEKIYFEIFGDRMTSNDLRVLSKLYHSCLDKCDNINKVGLLIDKIGRNISNKNQKKSFLIITSERLLHNITFKNCLEFPNFVYVYGIIGYLESRYRFFLNLCVRRVKKKLSKELSLLGTNK